MPSEYNVTDLVTVLKDLGEDSPDLTDDEVERAIPALSTTDIAERLGSCPRCGAPSVKVQYAVRRRKPHTYWRVSVVCEKEHESQLVFRIDYEQEES